MKILHVTDYLMPSMGYQDFLLAKWNKKQNNDTYIITSNKYYPVPNYDLTWKKFLGKREQKIGWSVINGVKILRKNLYFEISCRPWISNLENEIKKIKPDVILVHNTTSFSSTKRQVIEWGDIVYPLLILRCNILTFCLNLVSEWKVLGSLYPIPSILYLIFIQNNL